MKKVILSILLFLFMIISAYSKEIEVKKGRIDINKTVLDEKGYISLDGDWEVYSEKFIFSEEIENMPDTFYDIPGSIKQVFDDKDTGHVTMRLQVDNLESGKLYGLYLPQIRSAYRLYINKKKVSEAGQVGIDRATMLPKAEPKAVIFYSEAKTTEFIFHISNYYDPWGGIWESIYMGEADIIKTMENKKIGVEFFFVGALLIIGIYQLSLFSKNPKQLYLLYFSGFCMLMAGRILTTGSELINYIFPGFNWTWNYKLEYFTYFVGVVLFSRVIAETYNYLDKKNILKILNIIGIFLGLAVIITTDFTNNIVFFIFDFGHIVTICNIILGVVILIKGVKSKEQGALENLLGGLILACIVINDILVGVEFIKGSYLVPYGVFAYIIFQMWIIAARYANAFRTAENLYEELDIQNKKLERIDKIKDSFLYNTSNKLQSPLNNIIGVSEDIKEKYKICDKAEDGMELIHKNARHLRKMVMDILEFEKLKNNEIKIEKEKTDLYTIVDNIIPLLHYVYKEKNIKIENNIKRRENFVWADIQKVEQLFYNVIENALKYSFEGPVKIETKKLDDKIRVIIKDKGMGIVEDKQKNIFKAFEYYERSLDEVEGIGMGLPLSKKIVDLHNGELYIKSKYNEGTEVIIDFPKAENGNYVIKSYDKKILSKNFELIIKEDQKSIFIVDDDVITLQTLGYYLQEMPYNLILINNSEDLMQKMKKYGKPEILILDTIMPKISGYELCVKLRKTYSQYELPIIFVVKQARIERVEDIFEVGGNDYIEKPIEKYSFRLRVSNLIKQKEAMENILKYQEEKEKREFIENLAKATKNLSRIVAVEEIPEALNKILEGISTYSKLHFFIYDEKKKFRLINAKTKDLEKNLNKYADRLSDIKRKDVDKKVIVNEEKYGIYLKRALLIPVFYHEKINAIIILEDIDEKISQYKINLIFALMGQIGFAIENVKMLKELFENKSLNSIVALAKAIVHELRTPISAIKGFSHLAYTKMDTIKNGWEKDVNYIKIKKYISTIEKESERVDQMAKELLEYAAIKDVILKKEKLYIKEFFEDIFMKNKYAFDLDNIEFYVNAKPDDYIYGDKEKLYTAFYSIIKNSLEALDYQKEKNIIRITYVDEEEGKYIEIEDNGIGLAREIKDSIIKPLVTTKTQGTGLGLAIANGIIEKHGWRLSFSSEQKKWTKAKITIL